MRVALMIEGQEDVSWAQWATLADACEAFGIEALFRSDHYLTVNPFPGRGSLDAWAVINALASRTSRLRLGTMVSPASFRHPSVLARQVTTADHVSGGRVELGLGTGWFEAEHRAEGIPLAPMAQRMRILEEQLTIIHDGHWGNDPAFCFAGEHYQLENLDAQPKPVQSPHVPLLMGGLAGPRAASLAARFADEYNTHFPTMDEIVTRRQAIVDACRDADRPTIPFSVMTTVVLGPDAGAVAARAEELGRWRGEPVDLDAERGRWLIGTPDEVVARLTEYAAAGVSRIYLQHLLHSDVETVELIGRQVVPAVASL